MTIDRTDALAREAGLVAAAARGHDPAAPVPACPGWDLAQLVRHLGGVYVWGAEVVRTGAEVSRQRQVADQVEPAELVDWFEAAAAGLVGALRATSGDADVWNDFGGPRTVATWAQRMLAETLVHRWDAEGVSGTRRPMAPAEAVDGVDEWVTRLAPRRAGRLEGFAPDGSLHLHATDVDGEWTLRWDGRQVQVERGHAKGDAAVRAPAEQLLLWAWGRTGAGDGGAERFGRVDDLAGWAPLFRPPPPPGPAR